MKALFINCPGEMEVKEAAEPKPGAGEVLIRVRASGICGTDVHILEGGFPGAYPLIPGHEFCGEVVEVGPGCSRIKVGDRVAVEPNVPCNNCPECLRGDHHYCRNMIVPGVNRPGGFGEYVVVLERGVFSVGDLDFAEGALVEPLSCVLHAVEMLAPKMSDRALVMGAGPIGLMLGRVLKSRGIARVDYLERLDERRNYAAKEGMGDVFAGLDEVPEKHYECVLDATGVGMLVSEAANRFVRARGKVLIFGVPHLDSEIRLNHFRVMRDEIQIISSFTSIKNTFQAIDLMRSGTVKMDGIISDRIPLSKAPEYVLRMKNGDGGIRKVTVTDFHS